MPRSKDEILNLVAAAQAGDVAAFGILYQELLNPIFRFIRYQVKDQIEAEDLAQEVFVKAWSKLDQFSDRGFTFQSWLYQIARTTVLDWFKKKKMVIVDEPEQVFGNLESPHGDPLAEAIQNETAEQINEALADLSHTDREVLVLYYVSDLGHAEISAILGLSEEAVRQRKSRALRSLKAKFGR